MSILAAAIALALCAGGAWAFEIERPADAIEVFHCDFNPSWDANFDEWPDRWTRRSATGYPQFVNIHVREADEAESTAGRTLEIELDGASAAVSSPPIRVMSRFSYLLVTRLYVTGLERSEVTVSIDFFNSSGKLLQTESKSLKSRKDGWHTIALESIDPNDPSIDRAIVTLDVKRTGRGDLKAKVALDDVWLARLPRITVSTNSPSNVYRDQDEVVVRCELSGIREQNPEIRFQLLDVSKKELEDGSFQLDGRLIVEDTKKASDIVDGVGNSPKGYEGFTEWRPKIPHHGFYSVVVTMLSSDKTGAQSEAARKMDRRVIWIAVVPPMEMPLTGDFGWSLPEAEKPLSFQNLAALLRNAGVNWVKIPAWYNPADSHRGDEIIRFVEMLSASNIQVVGVIDRPPAGTDVAHRLGSNASMADMLGFDQTLWLPVLDPVMSRLSMRLRYWQLGSDQDGGFVGFPEIAKRITELRQRLFRFGQQVKLGLPWTCDLANSPPADASWNFEQLTPDPTLTIEQFEQLVARPHHGSMLRWITVQPPPRPANAAADEMGDLNSRATEFVRKLVAAKEHGINAIFVSRPFDDQGGLMRKNGMPAELLLPWRTTACMLSGAKYLGSVQLPGGSENRNFLRPDGQVVMVVWNAEPTTETLFVGNDAKEVTVWGVSQPLPVTDYLQTIKVGPTPKFVLGVNEPIVRWRMALKFKYDHVESIFSRPHPNAIEFQNFFDKGVGGQLTIVAPQAHDDESPDPEEGNKARKLETPRWSIEPPEHPIVLSPNEAVSLPFDVRLKNAIFGEQPIRVDFVVDAGEIYHFSVYRTMWVGTGDVAIEFKSHIDGEGTLVVEQFMTNKSPIPVDFKCSLYAKGFRRQRSQVYRLGETPDRTVYRYANGAELIGKELMLEAEEIGGERVLKYRFLVTDQPTTPMPTSPATAPNKPTVNDRQTLHDVQSAPADSAAVNRRPAQGVLNAEFDNPT